MECPSELENGERGGEYREGGGAIEENQQAARTVSEAGRHRLTVVQSDGDDEVEG